MSPLALALVLVAAVVHATWNLLAKRVGGGAPFVWLFGALSALIYAPLAVAAIIIQRPQLGTVELGFIVGSALLHIGYYLLLQRGYRVGDLSLVYPLARGTGPALATAAAIIFFGERPTPLALSGALIVVGGVFVLAGGGRRTGDGGGEAVAAGLMTGTVIAAYTLWDKHAVGALLIPPLVLDWGTSLCRAALLAPVAWRRRDAVRACWREHRRAVLGVALLNPLSYILVLTALVFTPVSYVAPAREVSILVGALFGARLLGEGDVRRRLAAAGVIVLGVVALAVG